jgi:hypothetical protein
MLAVVATHFMDSGKVEVKSFRLQTQQTSVRSSKAATAKSNQS